ncbi:MAG: hypothetical protein GY847_10355 [Proteobacteria bacterium]|nr:hypothetical protein [Pseudomonadota bacterium]
MKINHGSPKNQIILFAILGIVISFTLAIVEASAEVNEQPQNWTIGGGRASNETRMAETGLIVQGADILSDTDQIFAHYFAPRVRIRPNANNNNRKVFIEKGSEVRIGPPAIPVHISVLCSTDGGATHPDPPSGCQGLTEESLRQRVELLNQCFYTEEHEGEYLHPVRFVFKSATTFDELDTNGDLVLDGSDALGGDPCLDKANNNYLTGENILKPLADQIYDRNCDSSIVDYDAVNLFIVDSGDLSPMGVRRVRDPLGVSKRRVQPILAVDIVDLDKAFGAGFSFSPDVFENCPKQNFIAHEFGHALGLYHTYEERTTCTDTPFNDFEVDCQSHLMTHVDKQQDPCPGWTPKKRGYRNLGIPFDVFNDCSSSSTDKKTQNTCFEDSAGNPHRISQVSTLFVCNDDLLRIFDGEKTALYKNPCE